MRLFLFLLLALAFCAVNGQNYGNEWISFSSNANDYVKFQTKDDNSNCYQINDIQNTLANIYDSKNGLLPNKLIFAENALENEK